ncbi:MAG: hypothetical protein GY797_33020 [Deltaproteobacteria bacterium]|nr:hypothetical protein [Deltaproteobacteria bacterium]
MSEIYIRAEKAMPYLLTAMLESEDYKALQAYGGQEGIDLAVENHPDAHKIPIMIYTGKDLTRRIAGSSTVMSRPSAQNRREKSSC